jgi:hypothetical protein
MTDYKQLCADLTDELAAWVVADEDHSPDEAHYRSVARHLVDRARAAMAQPEPEGPTRAYLRQVFEDQSGFINDEQVMWWSDFHAAARAVLACWGTPNSEETRRSLGDAPQLAACPACEGRPAFSNSPCVVCGTERPAPQPADGEVAEVEEVVKWLRSRAGIPASPDFPAVAAYLTRAADLLERLGPPQPIPVSERLPGPEDCDAEGRCWWYGEGGDMIGWTLDAEGLSYYRAKYWLPARTVLAPGATCNPYLPVQ